MSVVLFGLCIMSNIYISDIIYVLYIIGFTFKFIGLRLVKKKRLKVQLKIVLIMPLIL